MIIRKKYLFSRNGDEVSSTCLWSRTSLYLVFNLDASIAKCQEVYFGMRYCDNNIMTV